MIRLVPVLWLVACGAPEPPAPLMAKYEASCMACHATGAADAPRVGSRASWQPRLDKGMDTLLRSVRGGRVGMPAGGRCGDCSDDDLRQLIRWMSSPAR